MVIESMHEKTEEAMCKLLQALFRSFIISIDQMRNVSAAIFFREMADRYLIIDFQFFRDLSVSMMSCPT